MHFNQQIYVWKTVLQNFNIKNKKSNINVNIYKILHLSFDMLCYSPEIMMVRWKMHWKLSSLLKRPVVRNRAPSTTK